MLLTHHERRFTLFVLINQQCTTYISVAGLDFKISAIPYRAAQTSGTYCIKVVHVHYLIHTLNTPPPHHIHPPPPPPLPHLNPLPPTTYLHSLHLHISVMTFQDDIYSRFHFTSHVTKITTI